MNFTDPISDLFTRIRNAQKAGHELVVVPASTMKIGLTHLLKREGFIKNYKCVRDRKQGLIKILLKYEEGRGAICDLVRISRPGARIYKKASEIPHVKNGFGIGIYTTSKGLMTDHEARTQRLGGEYLCSVY